MAAEQHGPYTAGELIDLLVICGVPGDHAQRVPGIARRFGIKAQPIDNAYNAGYCEIRSVDNGERFIVINHLTSKKNRS